MRIFRLDSSLCAFIALRCVVSECSWRQRSVRRGGRPQLPQAQRRTAQGCRQGRRQRSTHSAREVGATHHEMTLGGKTLKYTATAGTLLIRDEEDKPYGSMFYVAYTLDGAEAATRPVSFLYNGGPGSATLWLHMGSFSPVRIADRQPQPDRGTSVQAGAQRILPARQDRSRLH